MFTTILFAPRLPEDGLEEPLMRLSGVYEVTEASMTAGIAVREWTLRQDYRRTSVALYQPVPEYGITHAVHVTSSEDDFSGMDYELTRTAVDHYNIVHTLVETLQPVFGLGDNDERFEPRHIPSQWQYRGGLFEEPFWLTIFGEGYTDRFGRQALLDAPVWHTAPAGNCVIALTTRNPFVASEGGHSHGDVEQEFMTYLDERARDDVN
jgi:hypothetical protein